MTLQLSQMVGRILLAVLTVGAFVALGLWANSGPEGLFSWLATSATASAGLLLSGALSHLSPARLATGRFAEPLRVLAEHPLLRVLATDRAARYLAALAFGVLVATAEAAVAGSVLAGVEDRMLRGALSLGLVATVAWALVALMTRQDAGASYWWRFGSAIGAALNLEARDVGRLGRALVAGVLRALVTVACRALVVITLPPVFANPWAVTFFALVAMTLITGGDVLLALARSLRGAVHVEGANASGGAERAVPDPTGTNPEEDADGSR